MSWDLHERWVRSSAGPSGERIYIPDRGRRDEYPIFIQSRAKLGPHRVFYVLLPWGCYDPEKKPLVSGYARTIEEAEAALERATPPIDGVIERNASTAQYYHRQLTEENRKQRPDYRQQEAIGHLWYGDESEGYYSVNSYEIVKRTAKGVFVRKEPRYPEDGCYVLDRAELEKNGSVYHRHIYHTLYLTREQAEAHLPPEIVEEMHRTGKDCIYGPDFYESRMTDEQREERRRRYEEYLADVKAGRHIYSVNPSGSGERRS